MSKGISANVGGSYQKAKASYVNVNGTWTEFGGLQWATVSNTPTGTYKGDDGHTYAYYTFTTSGTLTVTTTGLLEVLLVSGGGGAWQYSTATVPGAGGYVVNGLHLFDAQSHAVTVGNGGPFSSSISKTVGGRSSVGPVATGVAAMGGGTAAAEGTHNAAYISTITGQPLKVSGRRGVESSDPGTYGAGAATGKKGDAGVAIVKTRLN